MTNNNFKKDLSNKEYIKFDCEIKGEEWTKAIASAKKELIKKVKIDGYRPGSEAHTKKAASMVKDEEVWYDAIGRVANKKISQLVASEEFKEIEEEIVDAPANLDVKSVTKDVAVISFAFHRIPEVTLGDYKTFKMTAKEEKVSKEEVTNYIKNLAEKDALLAPKKGDTIEKGDYVVFDFEGFIDGKAFDGGSAKNFELEIGSNQFIPGFEDQMIGMKKGDQKSVNVTFPKDYHVKEMADKPAEFKLNIHDIKVKEKAEVNDEFVKSLNIPDVSNVKELEAHIQKYLENIKKQDTMEKFKVELFDNLAKITKLSYMDEPSVQSEMREINRNLEQTASQMGMKIDDLYKMFGKSKEETEKELRAKAETNVLTRYALMEVSEKEKIECTDKELNEYIEMIAKSYGMPLEEIKKNVENQKDMIESMIIIDKTINWFFDFYKTK